MDHTRTIGQAGWKTLATPMTEALSRLGEWRRRQQIQKSFGLTSEVLLRDIGLTPDDLVEALAQPLADDISDALIKAAVARAGNW